MKKMQWPDLKILLFLFVSLFFAANSAFSQISHHRLRIADSLFTAKQYTQSLDHYRVLLKNNQYSPAMLLKMAFIQEGLNQIGEALYYLNLYYLDTRDEATLDKMEELSVKYNLKGYASTDTDRAWTIYHDYHSSISIALIAVVIFLFSMAIYLKRRKQKSIAVSIVTIVLVLLFGVHINLGDRISTAIITTPNTYLMSGPSAGASVVSIISEGHRVEVTGKKDVWLKINWDGKEAYIKENNLLEVSL